MQYTICGFIDPNVSDPVDVTVDVDGVTIEMTDYRGVRRSIKVGEANYQGATDIFSGHFGRDVGFQLVWDSERFNTRDAASAVADRLSVPDITDSKFTASITQSECRIIIAMPLRNAPQGATHQFVEAPFTNSPREWLAAQDPAIEKLVRKNKLKREALANISLSDSVAELEKQLDMLTAMVAALVTGSQQPTWSQQFLDVVSANTSAIQIDAALADIQAQKQKIRAIQLDYFVKRSQIG